MKRRIIITAVSLAVCVLLAVLLGIGLAGNDGDKKEDTTVQTTVDLLDNEVSGFQGKVQIFPKINEADVRSIYISNENGDFKIVRRNGALVIDGHEGLTVDKEAISWLVINAGFTISTFRSEVSGEEDFAKYGLAEGKHAAYFEITTTLDETYSAYIGDRTLSGDGYYVRYPGRNAIYVLSSGIKPYLLGTAEGLVSKMLVYHASINAYILVPQFVVMRDGEVHFAIDYLNPEERSELAAASLHKFSYPESYSEYYAGESYTSVLKIFSSLVCDEVVSLDLSDESLASFGIDANKPAYGVTYHTVVLDDEGVPAGAALNMLFFSEKQRDENGEFYYVASTSHGIIGRVDSARLDFLTWELDKYVNGYIFPMNINDVKTLAIKSREHDVLFELSGDTNETLSVVEKNSGFVPKTIGDFRDLWHVMLMVSHDGISDISAEDRAKLIADDNPMLTLGVLTKAGNKREFKFYQYTDRRVFYTVNGEGEFYVTRTMLDKLIADVGRLLAGEPIDTEKRF